MSNTRRLSEIDEALARPVEEGEAWRARRDALEAERQALLHQLPPAEPKRKKPKRPPSRTQRWQAAAAKAADAVSKLRDAQGELEEAASELREIQEEYELWKDSLPENLQGSALGEKLEEVCNIDIESIAEGVTSAIDDAESTVGEAEGVDLPLGFGRD